MEKSACDQVEEFEKRAKTKVGVVIGDRHQLPETHIYAIKFMPHWQKDVIAKYQREDPELKKIYEAKFNWKERPDWNFYSGESPTCKAYFLEWKRIEMWREVLYRRWENGDGSETRLQLIVPRALQQTICREIHDGRAASHLGKKRCCASSINISTGTRWTGMSAGGYAPARSARRGNVL